MLKRINRNQLYLSILMSLIIFIVLAFIIEPTSIFGFEQIILNKTGYFFGVDIGILDYFLISLIPIFGLVIYYKKKMNGFKEILKVNLIMLLSCVLTFSIGLLLLISKLGSPGENPLIPKYLRVEPFQNYSTCLIAIGIILPFILLKKNIKEINNKIEEIGKNK